MQYRIHSIMAPVAINGLMHKHYYNTLNERHNLTKATLMKCDRQFDKGI